MEKLLLSQNILLNIAGSFEKPPQPFRYFLPLAI
jgi:hypothetical protein